MTNPLMVQTISRTKITIDTGLIGWTWSGQLEYLTELHDFICGRLDEVETAIELEKANEGKTVTS